eukprot:2543441-Pleurochrysis_carterae.AAC.1
MLACVRDDEKRVAEGAPTHGAVPVRVGLVCTRACACAQLINCGFRPQYASSPKRQGRMTSRCSSFAILRRYPTSRCFS